jgi:hypothetical protein
MDDVKQGYREAKNTAKEQVRKIDGDSPADGLGNLGDDVRDTLGNGGDAVKNEPDRPNVDPEDR